MYISIYLYQIIISKTTAAQTFGIPLNQSDQFKNMLTSATLRERKTIRRKNITIFWNYQAALGRLQDLTLAALGWLRGAAAKGKKEHFCGTLI